MSLTAAIISRQTELSPLLLKSLSFADEIIIVVDNGSVIPVKTGIHPHNRNLKYFTHPLNADFSAQRNFALSQAKSDWVLFVDSDEYVGTELQREIQLAILSKDYSAYLIKRLDTVFHQPLNFGETGHTQILRLARKDAGRFTRPVHEVWHVSGRVGELVSPLYHQKDLFVSEYLSRMEKYGQVDSQTLTQEGKPFSWFRLFLYPLAKFFLNYFLRRGLLDGTAGLFQAYLMSVQSLSVRIFQWENQN